MSRTSMLLVNTRVIRPRIYGDGRRVFRVAVIAAAVFLGAFAIWPVIFGSEGRAVTAVSLSSPGE